MPARNPPVPPDKAALRALARQRRAAIAPGARAAASEKIAAHCLAHPAVAGAGCAFIYVSTAEEVATHDLIEALASAGCQVLVPLVADRTTMQAVPFPGWAGLRPGVLGIPAPPPGPAWCAAVDVALVPCLAVTRGGDRLGYGGGYYDRWLAEHPRTVAIALAFAAQRVDALPVQAHDVPVTAIITEQGAQSATGKT